jgi:hypothetical protein
VAGFFAYAYKSFNLKNSNIDNSLGGANTEFPADEISESNKTGIEVEIQTDAIQSEGENGGGTLTICLDECGNGTCQIEDTECAENGMNCVCAETPEDCPQDCKK